MKKQVSGEKLGKMIAAAHAARARFLVKAERSGGGERFEAMAMAGLAEQQARAMEALRTDAPLAPGDRVGITPFMGGFFRYGVVGKVWQHDGRQMVTVYYRVGNGDMVSEPYALDGGGVARVYYVGGLLDWSRQ